MMPARKAHKSFSGLNLVSPYEAAKHIPISQAAFYRWIKDKDCPIALYKPFGRKKPMVDLNEVKKHVLNSAIDKPAKRGAPRKR